MSDRSLRTTLRTLEKSKAEFILVGGLAAVLNGAPIQTYDIDIVYSQDPANIQRLLIVLESLNAIFRIQPERALRPNASHLSGSGYFNLLTRGGPLDLLATIGNNLGYQDLLPYSCEMAIDAETRVWVLKLEMIIALKEELAGEKDTAVLPLLRQTLRELQKKTSG